MKLIYVIGLQFLSLGISQSDDRDKKLFNMVTTTRANFWMVIDMERNLLLCKWGHI